MSGLRILSDAQIEEMCALRERGWSAVRIAEHFTASGTPVSSGSIEWQCLLHGADAPPALRGTCTQPTEPYRRGDRIVRPYSAEEDARLLALDAAGAKLTEMARALGRRHNSIKGRMLTLARREARAEEAAE